MARIHVFADEAGNFDFSLKQGASRYFVLTTVSFFDDRAACSELQQLRFDLAWSGIEHPGPFHATADEQQIRDRVFDVLKPHGFRIDATILEKRRAQPQIRTTDERFYQYAWFYHLRHVAPQIAGPEDELLVVGASLGTRRKQQAFHGAMKSVVRQVSPSARTRTAYWPAASEPGLQIADYSAWAIQRKWERDDLRSHDLIRDKISSEFELFKGGGQYFY